MKFLILGGKKFIGYHIALEAERRGHDITFFNRGKTYPELLPQFEVITGDRNTNIERLTDMTFDVVIDTCAYFPDQVKSTCEVLGKNISRYILVSTVSVYDISETDIDETTPVDGYDFESVEVNNENYGKLKAAAEKELLDQLGEEKSLIIRPGFIVGERDHTDRFTFWPVMMYEMNRMFVPETGDLTIQFIDVKDLAAFIVMAAERQFSGRYILTGPEEPYLFNHFIKDCRRVVNPECELIFVSDNWLKTHEIDKAAAFPLCYDMEGMEGIHRVNVSKAMKDGLHFRTVDETLKDALRWFYTYKKSGNEMAAGMKPDEMKRKG